MSGDAAGHKREWRLLHHGIVQVIDSYGCELAKGGRAVWVSSKRSPGCYSQFVTLYDLRLLQPEMLAALRMLLAKYRDWSIEIQVAAPAGECTWDWRDMIIEISYGRIIDRMRHDLLPDHLRQVRFGTTIDEYNEEMAAKVRRLMRQQV
ncbi:hypothetical protein [Rhodopseudomonas palustris]|uniref:Uncharacterized protein n=1 Tax=Rhodopseudomonas palustris TaxID=1076 RepID=A0A418VE15_RHOPL|nr:hypothetical protein [Rhodopseudomonas palustris]RJF74339.1 hypothetical protein D4Q52_12650 [Rhodopseudomonas palustris]